MTQDKTAKPLTALLTISEGSRVAFVENDDNELAYMVILYPTDDRVIIPIADFAVLVQAFHDNMLPPEGSLN